MKNQQIKQKSMKRRAYFDNWNDRIKVVEEFFKQNPLKGVIKINSYTTILDAEKYINSGINYAKANNGNPTFEIYLIRIEELKKIAENEKLQMDIKKGQ